MLKAMRRTVGNMSARGHSCGAGGAGGCTASLGGAISTCAGGDYEKEEFGTWHYLVVDKAGIRPREESSYSKDSKRTDLHRIKEGTLVEISHRRRSGWTWWLELKSGGWLFDVSPKDKEVRLVEVEVLTGEWQYQVGGEISPIFAKPSMHLAARQAMQTVRFLDPQEVVTVRERMRPVNGKGSFLRLADGRGFVLDFVRGRQALQRWQPEGPCSEATAASSGEPTPRGTSPRSPRRIAAARPPRAHAQGANGAREELGEPEIGEWTYVVLDPKGVCLRGSATYDKAQKLPARVEEGELVKVIERRIGCGTTFLRLESPEGWGLDAQPGLINKRQRMMEVTVDYGTWFYRIVASDGIAMRSRCSFSADAKAGKGPSEGAIVTVTKRVQVGDTMFLRAKGESGWIFDVNKNGRRVAEGPLDLEVLSDTTATVTAAGGIYLRSVPSTASTAATKMLLLEGARVQVEQRIRLDGMHGVSEWSFVTMKAGGRMEGWVSSAELDLKQGKPSCVSEGVIFHTDQVLKALNAPMPIQEVSLSAFSA